LDFLKGVVQALGRSFNCTSAYQVAHAGYQVQRPDDR